MTELTTSEVAALFDLDERRVRKDVEYGVFGRIASPPRFDLAEVVYLYTVAGIGFELGVEDRKKLYRMISVALRGQRAHDLELGAHVIVKLGSTVHDVEARLIAFERWKKRLVEREDILGGEPVFPKTRLAVRHVGEMARRGASVEEITSDYPNLSEQDVEFAQRYAAAYPRVGRPRGREAPARRAIAKRTSSSGPGARARRSRSLSEAGSPNGMRDASSRRTRPGSDRAPCPPRSGVPR